MLTKRLSSSLGLAALVVTAACNSLDVTNPNDPDRVRALRNPAAIEAIAGGTMVTWYNTWYDMETAGVLSTTAQAYSASWNNFNMNFYSSIDADGSRRSRAWQNDLASAGRTNVEASFTGYYSVISSANDVLAAIRGVGLNLGTPAANARAEAIAQLMSGAAHMGIALNYDKGYVLTENTDPNSLAFVSRRVVRDSAVAFLQRARTIALATPFTTPANWTNGAVYTNVQIAALANTLTAMALAYYPRNDTENAAVDWARVATLTASGIGFDFDFFGDGCTTYCPELLGWFNAMDTGVVSTRVAALMDPTQIHPYFVCTAASPPGCVNGSPQPNSADRRMGDGSFGTAAMTGTFGNIPRTANGGSDFAYTEYELFNPARGMYHQSNIAHVRYDVSGVQDPNGIWGWFGRAPAISRTTNDLLRAEAEIRRAGGDLAIAAQMINNTRVTRGGLAPATAGEGAASLTTKLIYEQEIELLGLGPSPFYQRRRVPNGLLVGTPREMPVPAKELGVLGQAFYTWGGTGPANSPTPP